MAMQTPQFVTSFTTKRQHSFSPILTIRFKNPFEQSVSIPKKTGFIFAASDRKNMKKKKDRQREKELLMKRRNNNQLQKPGLVSEQVQQPVQQSANENGSVKQQIDGNENGSVKQQQRERASTIIRRNPVEKPAFASEKEQPVQQSPYENAFTLAWLGFALVILVEGIALAASAILPEDVDKFIDKYLYPSFTPTIALFVAGSVAFGVVKYKQDEKQK